MATHVYLRPRQHGKSTAARMTLDTQVSEIERLEYEIKQLRQKTSTAAAAQLKAKRAELDKLLAARYKLKDATKLDAYAVQLAADRFATSTGKAGLEVFLKKNGIDKDNRLYAVAMAAYKQSRARLGLDSAPARDGENHVIHPNGEWYQVAYLFDTPGRSYGGKEHFKLNKKPSPGEDFRYAKADGPYGKNAKVKSVYPPSLFLMKGNSSI